MCFFILGSISSVLAVAFKTMHWPGAGLLVYFSGFAAMLFILMLFVKKEFRYDGLLLSFKERLRKIPGKNYTSEAKSK